MYLESGTFASGVFCSRTVCIIRMLNIVLIKVTVEDDSCFYKLTLD